MSSDDDGDDVASVDDILNVAVVVARCRRLELNGDKKAVLDERRVLALALDVTILAVAVDMDIQNKNGPLIILILSFLLSLSLSLGLCPFFVE